MSELKSVYIDRTGDWVRSGNDTGKFYLKSEVDKYILKLKADLVRWNDYAHLCHGDILRELRHSNRKRCLAMAKYCELREDEFGGDFAKRWLKRWLALAAEPTWAKFLQLIHKEAK